MEVSQPQRKMQHQQHFCVPAVSWLCCVILMHIQSYTVFLLIPCGVLALKHLLCNMLPVFWLLHAFPDECRVTQAKVALVREAYIDAEALVKRCLHRSHCFWNEQQVCPHVAACQFPVAGRAWALLQSLFPVVVASRSMGLAQVVLLGAA